MVKKAITKFMSVISYDDRVIFENKIRKMLNFGLGEEIKK